MKEAKVYIKDLFYFDGPNKTTPDCPVKIVPDYDPTNGKKTDYLKGRKIRGFRGFCLKCSSCEIQKNHRPAK